MNWDTFIAIGSLLGGWEAIKYFINRKSNKRMNESEADKKEIEADADEFHLYKERIEELRTTNAEVNKQNYELIKSGAKKDEIIEAKNVEIQGLQELRIDDTKRISELEKQVQFYKSWHCQREYGRGKECCTRRKPAQNPPLKYEPIEND